MRNVGSVLIFALMRKLLLATAQVVCVLAIAIRVAGAVEADEGDLKRKGKILFKIATYDSSLPDGAVNVVVVYPSSDATVGPAAVDVFTKLAKMKLNGRDITITGIAYASKADLQKKIVSANPYGLFVVHTVPSSDVAGIAKLVRASKLFSFGDDPAFVEQGLMAGFGKQDGRNAILLNLKTAIASGRQLDGALIKICSVIN